MRGIQGCDICVLCHGFRSSNAPSYESFQKIKKELKKKDRRFVNKFLYCPSVASLISGPRALTCRFSFLLRLR
jgi:hypothetical protein